MVLSVVRRIDAHLSFELCKFQTPTVKLYYVHRFGRIGLLVRGWRGFDIG